MKKLLSLIVLLLCAVVGVKAQSTIGLTQDYTESPVPTSANKVWTSLNEANDHLTLTQQIGSKITNYGKGDKGDVILDGSTLSAKNNYMGCWRTGDPGTAYDDQYVGFDLTVSEGYALNISSIQARVLYISAALTWKVQILNSSNVVLYESGEKSCSNKGTTAQVSQAVSSLSAEDKAKLEGISGIVKVRLFIKGGKTKYFGIDKLTITAETVSDDRPTYTLTTNVTPANSGTVSPETGEQVEGTDAVLTATPNTGYKFIKWTIDGVDIATNPYTINNINAAHTAVATFEALPKITFEKGDGMGTAPSVDYAEMGASYQLPASFFLYKEGATLTGWNDGENTYAIGASYTISGDVSFTAVYEDNSVDIGDAATTVNWTFATKDGAPTISCEGSEMDYVQKGTINKQAIDVVMHINTKQDAGINGSRGKVNNLNANNCAQVNGGTVFTIPAKTGMVITVTATNIGNASVNSMKFDGNDADSYSSGILTYTYNGSATSINIIDQGNSLYPSGITVEYPFIPKYAPESPSFPGISSVSVGGSLSLTSDAVMTYYQWSDSEVALTTESSGWISGTNVQAPNETGTKYLYAYASNGTDYNSTIVSKVFTIVATKNLVTKNWDFTSWSTATKEAMIADGTAWNQYERTDNGGLDFEGNGRSNVSALSKNTLKYGSTNIPETDGLKFTAGAYGLGLMFNLPSTELGTYHGSSYIWLYNNASKIIIPNMPKGATIAIGVESHKGTEARGITLDNATQTKGEATATDYQDCEWTVTTAGDITITPTKGLHIYYIKVTETVPESLNKTISSAGYATLCSEYPLDFTGSGLTAYIATVSGDKVSFSEVTSVPANTGVLVKGTAGEKTINVAESVTDVSANVLKGVLADTPIAAEAGLVLMGSGSAGVAFYKNTNAFTVGANTAYIPAAVAPTRQFIGFDFNEATTIKVVESVKAENAAFNLRGQRVKNLTKGLYIVNGKKVVK